MSSAHFLTFLILIYAMTFLKYLNNFKLLPIYTVNLIRQFKCKLILTQKIITLITIILFI